MQSNHKPKPPTLSAVIITKNEAKNIEECLTSLYFCDEIIVLDNGSEDNTVDIARKLGAKVVSTEKWLGFGPQKQAALKQATGRWILSVDADERVSERLGQEILKVLQQDDDFSYSLERTNFFMGREMRFGGWSGDWVVRLAKREHCNFSADLVHESLRGNHPTRRLSGPLIHISYRTIDDVFKKQIRYAELGAEKLMASGKYSRHPALRAAWTFVRLYLVQFGFLDGWRGTLAATAKSYETFWRYALASKGRK
jgi:glycosyltransferase involved in cell wall biosynthesis